ncbi:iron-sulfur cluster assembly scaffold protein [Candidatus Micrarchaeota archaeon]|nr:iron-sulfur cluster assembly scaffold protein [Candidatus Micrarchaeota archaeon]
MLDIYGEQILELSRHPRHRGAIRKPSAASKDSNPLCGDEIEFQLLIGEDGKITDAKFSGQGCAISMASADLIANELIDKKLSSVKGFDKAAVFSLLGMHPGPSRVKCALLPLKVVKMAAYSKLGAQLTEKEAAME